jgi:hypothetical protein
MLQGRVWPFCVTKTGETMVGNPASIGVRVPSLWLREVRTTPVFAAGAGPEWQAVQLIFSR